MVQLSQIMHHSLPVQKISSSSQVLQLIQGLLLAPLLNPSNNLVHISDTTEMDHHVEEGDMKLEEEIKHYIQHLAEEQEAETNVKEGV